MNASNRNSSSKVKLVALLASVAALVLVGQSAKGQTGTADTWTLAATGTWGSGANSNWSTGNAPTSTNDAYFNTSSAAETITLGAGDVAQGLYINNASAVSFTGGNLTLGSDGLTIAAGSGIFSQGSTFMVIGASQTWTNNSSNSYSASIDGFAASSLSTTATLTLTGTGGWGVRGGLADGSGGGALTLTIAGGTSVSWGNTAANTYSGGTNIQNGTDRIANVAQLGSGLITLGNTTGNAQLQVVAGGTIANAITTAGTGTDTLSVSQSSAADTYSGTFTLNNTTTALILGTTASSGSSAAMVINGLVQGSGGLNVTNESGGNGILAVSFNNANTYSGGTTIGSLTLNINNGGTATSSAIGTGTLTINGGTINNTSGGAITLGTNNAVVLGGNFTFGGANNLNFGTGAVTDNGSHTITLNTSNSSLVFGGTLTNTLAGANTLTVNEGASVTGASITFGGYALSNSATNYTDVINGSGNVNITGAVTNGGTATAGGLTYSGTGTLGLSGASTYTGTTTINSGVLELGNGGATGSLSSSSPIVDKGTFIINRNNAVTQGIDFSSAAITGAGGLIQAGTGTTTLSAANSYTGTTTINAGALNITGSTYSAGAVIVNSGGALKGAGSTGLVTLNSGGAINLADGVIGTLTIGSLTTTGGGSLTFEIGGTTTNTDKIADSGALSASGSTVINVANLGGVGQTLATGTYTILSYTGTAQSLSDFTLSSNTLDGKTLSLAQSGDNIEIVVTGSGSATGTTYTLVTTAGSTLLHSGATTTLTTVVTNTGTGTADTLNYSGVGATAANGSVSGSNTSGGPLAQSGTGTTTQTYTATTTGSDTISATGSGTNATIGGSASGSSTGTTINVYSGVGVWNHNGGGSWGAVSATPTNWTANGGTPGITAGFLNTDSASFGSVLTSGTGSVTLDGDNPSLNAITFNDSAASYVIAQGTGTGSITLDGNGGNANVTDLAGSHTISAPIDLVTSANVNVASGQQLTVSGTVSGAGGLVNDGAGTTVLSGSNGYSGGTTVSSGTLQLSNSSGSATGSGALSVGAGAILAGTGFSSGSSFSITGNSSTVATVLVGHNSATDLNTTGVMHLSATGASNIGSANLVFNINSNIAGQGNQLNVGTTAITFNTVGSMKTTLTLNVEGTTYINGYTTYVLVAGTGTTSIAENGTTSGQYSGLTTFLNSKGQEEIETGGTSNLALAFSDPTQAGFYASSYLFLVNNGGVDDIEVEVVPEPGTWAMMLGGLAMLIVWQRRRRNV